MEERSFYYRYCIVIPESYSKVSEFFEAILKKNSFDIQTFKNKNNHYICLSQKDEQKMLKTAELLKLKKIYVNDNNLKENIDNEEKILLPKEIEEMEKERPFISSEKNNFIPQKVFNDLYSIDIKNKEKNNKRFGLDLFTESEILLIEKTILEKIPVENPEELKKLINEEKPNNLLSKLTTKEKSPFLNEESLFETLKNNHIIIDNFPLHVSDFIEKINKRMLLVKTPYNLVRAYFNDEIALYFAWLYHYTNFIIFPSIVSIIIFLSKYFISEEKIENVRKFHAIRIAIWVKFFMYNKIYIINY